MLTWALKRADFLYTKKWLSISPCCFLEEATVCKNGKAFCIRVFSVKNISGHVWVNCWSVWWTGWWTVQASCGGHACGGVGVLTSSQETNCLSSVRAVTVLSSSRHTGTLCPFSICKNPPALPFPPPVSPILSVCLSLSLSV